jgi:hypothetical protein
MHTSGTATGWVCGRGCVPEPTIVTYLSGRNTHRPVSRSMTALVMSEVTGESPSQSRELIVCCPLATEAPGLVTVDNGDEVDSVLAVHLEIPGVRDDLLLCGNTKPAQLRGSREDQHANNTDKTVLSGT